MANQQDIEFWKVKVLPTTLRKDALYIVDNGAYAEAYVTDHDRVAKYLGNSLMINQLIQQAIISIPNGLSAYQIAVINGFVGTEAEWLVSLKGDIGGVYTHIQAVPSSLWIINHGLGYKPNITVVDSTSRRVFGDEVYIDNNISHVSFIGGFSGEAYCS